jgi:FMN phosphatase YigB (HAD superfamily)
MRRIFSLLTSSIFAIQLNRISCLSKAAKVTLITFDVDGTLIHSSASAETASHSRAFSFGVGSIFQPNSLEEFRVKYPNPLSAVKKENYHGSTDGLIALHFAKNACGVAPEDAFPLLGDVFRKMFDYMSTLTDSEICRGIEVLPGVINTLEELVARDDFGSNIMCGLVTGNVEGIARKKMRACGILATKVLYKSAPDQQQWAGEEHSSFLGGFGSDFCSGDISDSSRIFKDRGEQIAVAYRRAKSLLSGQSFQEWAYTCMYSTPQLPLSSALSCIVLYCPVLPCHAARYSLIVCQ